MNEVLKVEKSMIPRYQEKAIIIYKAYVRFRKGLERSEVISYQYEYYITLAHFKTRYPKVEI